MPYIPLTHDFFEHPKALALQEALDWPVDLVTNGLLRFWLWCLNYAPDGDLRGIATRNIANAFRFPCSRGEELVNAMIETGWLDVNPYLRVHNWWKNNGHYLQSKYRREPEKWQRVRSLYGEAPAPGSEPDYLSETITVSRLSADSQPSGDRLSADCQPTVDRLSADNQLTVISHMNRTELNQTELNEVVSLREKRGSWSSNRIERAGEEFLRRVKASMQASMQSTMRGSKAQEENHHDIAR